ncbi:MAG: hypothetical protein ACPG44_06375 [Polaribacter sp.]
MSLTLNLISTPHKCIRRKNILFLFVIVFSVSTLSAQQKKNTTAIKTFLQELWAENLKDGLVFMPIASHTTSSDISNIWYTSYSYKNLELAVFKNSYEDWTLGLLYKRTWYLSEKVYISYGGGIMYGYKGKLGLTGNVPFRNSFLFTGPINPAIGIDLDYKIDPKVSIHVTISPLVVTYGLKYYFK